MKNQGQLFLISTAGDSTSDLMQAYRQRALDRLEDPEPGSVLLLEWSAPAEADPDQVDTWRWGSPAWDDKREAFVRQQWHRIEESAFRREYLNMWVIRSNHWLKESYWNACLDPLVELPNDGVWSVAVECDFDGMGHAVAIAAPNVNGHIVVRVTTHRTIVEVDEQLRKIRALHPSLYIQVTPGYVDRIREKFDDLVGQREAVVATQILVDLFSRLQIRHDGSQILQEHFGNSTISQRQVGGLSPPRWVEAESMPVAPSCSPCLKPQDARSVAMIRSRDAARMTSTLLRPPCVGNHYANVRRRG